MAINELSNLPDISFISGETLDSVESKMMAAYQDKYLELTGKRVDLERADPETLILYACATMIYQGLLYVDFAGKQNLLKYATGDYLDNVAALKKVTRSEADPAKCTVRFTLSELKSFVTPIPAGTRVTDGETYFATTEYAEVPSGQLYLDVECTALEGGADHNGIIPGRINILVDPIPYMDSVANTDTTSGGSDAESDESLAYRTFLAPSSYSVAGPHDAYVYWTKAYSSGISDVYVYSPQPTEVVVEFLVDGEQPSETMVEAVADFLSDGNIRPLTDQVTVQAPPTTSFDLDVTYYIAESDSARASAIQTAVTTAIDDYVEWQCSTIGRDINPDVLVEKVRAAGGKRVAITSPSFTAVLDGSVPYCASKLVTYGGIEND